MKYSHRNKDGFTLVFAVMLSVIFASLLGITYYLIVANTKVSSQSIFKSQCKYLAESGTNRALAMFNKKSYPKIDLDGLDRPDDDDDYDYEDDDDDDNTYGDFGDDFFEEEDDDFGDDDYFDEDDDEFLDDDDEDIYDNEDVFLASIKRFTNFYHKDPFYVNIDTGQVVTEIQYLILIERQRERIARNKQEGIEAPQEIPIEELYFPLPEVNVQKIGSFNFKKGIHLKPGYKIIVANKIPINIKQKDILEEYYQYAPPVVFKPKIRIDSISPNFATQGDILDVFLEGENLDLGTPQFSTSLIQVYDYSPGVASIILEEKTPTGRYKLRFGANNVDFFVIPKETFSKAPIIERIIIGNDVNNQFTQMGSNDKLEGVTILGENLGGSDGKIVLVPDAPGFTIDVVSVTPANLVFNIKSRSVVPGEHYITLYTDGGYSRSWLFNVEKSREAVEDDPFSGSISTLATLLEVNSLSNLSYKAFVDTQSSSGRPGKARGSGRPSSHRGNRSRGKRRFDLLKSDLETVWRIETIAKVNNFAYKETRLIRRSAAVAEAALTTNSQVSFSASNIIITGVEEARVRLDEGYSDGETKLKIDIVDPDEQQDFEARDADTGRPPAPTGNAVVEDLGLNIDPNSLRGLGFKKNGIVTINSRTKTDAFSDFAYVESLSGTNLIIQKPGFKNSYFPGDEIVQFFPAVISPTEIGERDAERNLSPPGANIYLPGREKFPYVFKTKMQTLANWSNSLTDDTRVPVNNEYGIEGYYGLHIIHGAPDYSGSNALYGQGTLIIDTTRGGQNPAGSTVRFGGSSKSPALFEGIVYVIGEVEISGQFSLQGAMIVNSPTDNSTIRISGTGEITYSQSAIAKSLLGVPFTPELGSRRVERVSVDTVLINDTN